MATYKNTAGTGVGAPYGVEVDPNDTSACGNGNQATNCADFWVADQEQADVVEFDHTGHVIQSSASTAAAPASTPRAAPAAT